MNSLRNLIATAILTLAMTGLTACGDNTSDPIDNPGGGGKEDNIEEICPENVGINAASASMRRCYNRDNGQFVATGCCSDLCQGAGWREQLNGTRCVWESEPGLRDASVGQFAPNMCCHLNEEYVAQCDPSVHYKLRHCSYDLAWEREDDPELLDITPYDALQKCGTEGDRFGAIYNELCSREPAPTFCGLSMDQFSRKVVEPCLTDLEPEFNCVFGLSESGIFFSAARIAIVEEKTLTLENSTDLGPVARQQILEAVRVVAWEPIDTLEDAFDLVDFGEIYYHSLWEGSNGKAYEVYIYGSGDNGFGGIFEFGKAEVVVRIEDSDLYDANGEIGCGIPYGPRWTMCGTDSDCAAGLDCTGVIVHPMFGTMGRCVNSDLGIGSTVYECSPEQDCELDKGLVCAGATRYDGFGFCQPAWAIGTFEGQGRVAIPDGDAQGVQTSIYAWGLATVDEDVVLDLDIEHEDFSQLKITMTNPYGLEGDIITVFDGSKPHHLDALEVDDYGWANINKVIYTSGDEEVNGAWTLYLVDNTPGKTGRLYSWKLHLRSRLD